MAYVDESLETPSALEWSYGGSLSSYTGTFILGYDETAGEAQWRWDSTGTQFQFQFRVKRRFSQQVEEALGSEPYGDDADAYDTTVSDELWESWEGCMDGHSWAEDNGFDLLDECWCGNDVGEDEFLGTAYTERENGACLLTKWTFPVDFSDETYDAYEVQARVRLYKSWTNSCSAWKYSTLYVYPKPQVTDIAASISGGDVVIEAATTFMREGAVRVYYRLKDGDDTTAHSKSGLGSIGDGGASTVSWTVDGLSCLGDDETTVRLKQFYCWTDGSVEWGIPDVTIAALKPYSVPVGSLSTGTADVDLDVAVGDGGTLVVSAGSDCTVVASYTDEHGRTWCESYGLDAGESVTILPPLDVPVKIVAVATADGATATETVSAIVPSTGLVRWDYGDESFEMVYDPEESWGFEMDGETVKTAGADRPVSRYGEGGAVSIDVDGTYIRDLPGSDSMGDDWLAPMMQLTETHDWLLRTPHGGRFDVFVEKLAYTWESEGVVAVSVTMQEVDS